MAAVNPPMDGDTPNVRLLNLEWKLPIVEDRSKKNSDRLDAIEKADATTAAQILEAREDIKGLKGAIDKLVWSIVGMALTIATGAIGLALQQILSHQGTP